MARISHKKDPDRFLLKRASSYYYHRRVPANVAEADERSPFVRMSLKTDDLALARSKRDLIEEADNLLWASMIMGEAHIITHFIMPFEAGSSIGTSDGVN